MEALKTPDGSFTLSLLFMAGLLVVAIALSIRMKDSLKV